MVYNDRRLKNLDIFVMPFPNRIGWAGKCTLGVKWSTVLNIVLKWIKRKERAEHQQSWHVSSGLHNLGTMWPATPNFWHHVITATMYLYTQKTWSQISTGFFKLCFTFQVSFYRKITNNLKIWQESLGKFSAYILIFY